MESALQNGSEEIGEAVCLKGKDCWGKYWVKDKKSDLAGCDYLLRHHVVFLLLRLIS